MPGNKNSGPPKGKSNNPAGMPKGIKHKRTREWEKLGEFITEKGAQRAMQIMSKLDDATFLDQYGKLLNYFKPKISYNINQEEKPAVESIKFVVKK